MAPRIARRQSLQEMAGDRSAYVEHTPAALFPHRAMDRPSGGALCCHAVVGTSTQMQYNGERRRAGALRQTWRDSAQRP